MTANFVSACDILGRSGCTPQSYNAAVTFPCKGSPRLSTIRLAHGAILHLAANGAFRTMLAGIFKQQTLRAALLASAALLAYPADALAATESVLWKFGASSAVPTDGVNPTSELIMDGAGALYGTTMRGGMYDTGTVFKLVPQGGYWTEAILAEFPVGSYYPSGGFTNLAFDGFGGMYVASTAGGAANSGMVFKLAPSYQFPSYSGTPVSFQRQKNSGTYYALMSMADVPSGTGSPKSITTAAGGRVYMTTANGIAQIIPPDPNSSSSSSWTSALRMLLVYPLQNCLGVVADPSTGDLYVVSSSGGAVGKGEVFVLRQSTPSSAYFQELDV
jgi:uncharacterized repeat protein (TIGR03803 family)